MSGKNFKAVINPYNRYQRGLSLSDIFPKTKGICPCGCERESKKRWFSEECTQKALKLFWVIKGDKREIRKQLFEVENGICQRCGEFDLNWQADHIIPVHKGGGACTIDNFQTLCVKCHKEKTFKEENKFTLSEV